MMNANKKGIWKKYEADPNNRMMDKSSYNRLYEDLKGSNIGWPASQSIDYCYKTICGGDFMSDGSIENDVYVYYELTDSSSLIPKIYIEVCVDDDKNYKPHILGTQTSTQPDKEDMEDSFAVEVDLLEVLIAKLKDLSVHTLIIEEYEEKLNSYKELCRIEEFGLTGETDLLLLYKNLQRRDTSLAADLLKGRHLQKDFDMMSKTGKLGLLQILAEMMYYNKDYVISTLKSLVGKEKENLLEITDEELLIESATPTWLRSLEFASADLKSDKEFILRVLENFRIHFIRDDGFENYIPPQFRFDFDVLQVATKSWPYKLHRILLEKTGQDSAFLLSLKENSTLAFDLLNRHFRNTLDYGKNNFDLSLLHYLSDEDLAIVEDMVLYGPEQTPQGEQLKEELGRQIKIERQKIMKYRQSK